jgi:hypothetical protein
MRFAAIVLSSHSAQQSASRYRQPSSGGPGFSVRRAQGNHQTTLSLTAPSHKPPGIEQSHRRTLFLKPVLLDMDQLIGSAAPFALSSGSVRKMAHTTPTIHVRKARQWKSWKKSCLLF